MKPAIASTETSPSVDKIPLPDNIYRLPPVPKEYTGLRLLLRAKKLGRLGLYEEMTQASDEPIAQISVDGKLPRMMLKNRKSIEALFRSQDFSKPIVDFLNVILGKGQLLINGPEWKELAKLSNPALAGRNHEAIIESMVAVTDETLNRWQQQIDQNKPIKLSQSMTDHAFNILLRSLFNQQNYQNTTQLQSALGTILDRTSARLVTPRLMKLPEKWLYALPPYRGARKALFKAASDMITARRQHLAQAPNSPYANDLLSVIATKGNFSEETRKQQVLTFLLAGHETTAHAITFGLGLLSKNRHVWEKIKQEVRDEIGDEPITAKNISRLKYTRAVFKEILRLYPSVAAIIRQADKDTYLPTDDGRQIPIAKGQSVFTAAWGVQRDSRLWTDVTDFNPGRDLENPEEADNFMAFSKGGRKCPGEKFAFDEAVLLLAKMAQRGYDFDVHDVDKIKAHPAVTLRPENDVWMTISPQRSTL